MHCYMPIKDNKFAVGYFSPARGGTPQTKTSKGSPRIETQFITLGIARDAESAARMVNYLNGGTGDLPQGEVKDPPEAGAAVEGPASGFNEAEVEVEDEDEATELQGN